MRRRRGFTLVEMLAVALLSAMLMLAAFKVVGAMARSEMKVAAIAPLQASSQAQWRPLLHADLASARAVTFGSRVVVLGQGWLDAAGNRTQKPARVEYGVEDVAGDAWLVRYQTSLSDRGDGSRERQLLARGVRQFHVERVGDEEEGLREIRLTLNGREERQLLW